MSMAELSNVHGRAWDDVDVSLTPQMTISQSSIYRLTIDIETDDIVIVIALMS